MHERKEGEGEGGGVSRQMIKWHIKFAQIHSLTFKMSHDIAV